MKGCVEQYLVNACVPLLEPTAQTPFALPVVHVSVRVGVRVIVSM